MGGRCIVAEGKEAVGGAPIGFVESETKAGGTPGMGMEAVGAGVGLNAATFGAAFPVGDPTR